MWGYSDAFLRKNFESGFSGTGTIPDCWTKTNIGSASFTWTQTTGTSTGSATGPDNDNTFGNTSGNYLFTEASGSSVGNITLLEAPNFDITGLTSIDVSFWYHMFGADMGRLVLETSVDRAAWMPIDSLVGQQQTSKAEDWKQMTKTLTVSGSELKVRFRGVRGDGFTSDMAIDDLLVRETPTCFEPNQFGGYNYFYLCHTELERP